jgi:hypothetical protein
VLVLLKTFEAQCENAIEVMAFLFDVAMDSEIALRGFEGG